MLNRKENPLNDVNKGNNKKITKGIIKESLYRSTENEKILAEEQKKLLEQQDEFKPVNARKCQSGKYFIREEDDTDDGIYFVPAGADLEKKEKLCDPITVKYIYSDEDGKRFGRVLSFKDINGKSKTINVLDKDLAGGPTQVVRMLSDYGFHCEERTPSKRGSISEYLKACDAPTAFLTDSTGWAKLHNGSCAYILPGKNFGAENTKIVFENRSENLSFESKGTIDEWREKISKYAPYSSRICFAISAYFSAPLLNLTNLSTNPMFHFSGESSSGKSTTVKIASTVATYHKELPSWNATRGGIEGMCLDSKDLVLIIDEIMQAETPEKVPRMIYQIANGKEKGRLNQDASRKKIRSWKLVALSTGETGLRGILEKYQARIFAGQEIRFAEISSDAGAGMKIFERLPPEMKTSAELIKHFEKNIPLYHGTALPLYLEALVRLRKENEEELTDFVNRKIAEFVKAHTDDSFTPQIARVCQTFGLVAVGGTLASGGSSDLLGAGNITGWKAGEGDDWTSSDAYKAASKCFKDWLTIFGDPTLSREDAEYIKKVENLIFDPQNIADFSDLSPTGRGIPIGFVHRICEQIEEERVFVPSKNIEKYLLFGRAKNRVLNFFREQGMIGKDKNERIKMQPFNGQTKGYWFRRPKETSETS